MKVTLQVVSGQASALGAAATISFDEQGGTIGRIDGNDWILPDAERFVSSTHASVSFEAGDFYLTDRSTNGTFVNDPGFLVGNGNTVPLNDGDRLFVGDYEIVASVEDSAVTGPSFGASVTGAPPPVADPFPATDPSALVDGGSLDPMESLFGDDADPFGAPAAPPARPSIPDGADDQSDLDPLAAFTPPNPFEEAPPEQSWPADAGAAPDHASPLEQSFTPPAAGAPMIPDDDWDKTILPMPPAAPSPQAPAAPTPPPAAQQPAAPARPVTPPGAPPPAFAPPQPPPQPAFPLDTPPAADASGQFVPPPAAPPPAADASGQFVPPPAAPPPAADASGQFVPPPAAPPPAADASGQFMPPPAAPPPVADASGQFMPPPAGAPPPDASGVFAPAPGQPPADGTAQFRMPPGAGPAEGAPPGAGSVEGMQRLLMAAGVDPSGMPPQAANAVFQLAGGVFREVVQGMMEVLQARDALKSELRIARTTIQPRKNNPLKFSVSADEAITKLLFPHEHGYMAPVEALREAIDDIKAHQLAMMAGLRAALTSIMEQFEPDDLEERFQNTLKHSPMAALRGKSKYWEMYAEYYQQLAGDSSASALRLFGEDFAKAYQDQLDKLS